MYGSCISPDAAIHTQLARGRNREAIVVNDTSVHLIHMRFVEGGKVRARTAHWVDATFQKHRYYRDFEKTLSLDLVVCAPPSSDICNLKI